MLRVFRHYLPARRALLIASETVILTAVLAAGMSAHLVDPSDATRDLIAGLGLSPTHALRINLLSAFLLSLLSQVAIAFNELYDFRVSISRYERAARFVTSTGSAIALALAAVVLVDLWRLELVLAFPGLQLSQRVQTLVFTLLLGFGVLYVWRHVFHFLLRHFNFNERVLILGAGPAAQSLARELIERTDSGYEAVGLLPERETPGSERRARPITNFLPAWVAARAAGPPRPEKGTALGALLLDPLPETAAATVVAPADAKPNGHGNGHGNGNGHATEPLFDLVHRLRVDVVVVALEDRRGQLPTEELLRCRLAGIAVKEREALYEHVTGKIAVEALRPSYLIFNDGFGRSPKTELVKRFVDLLLSAFGLLLTWPLMLLTAIAVRLDSKGPILFTQERVGRDGQPFTLFKFRSMRADAETATGPVWATSDDPRITRVGRIMRRTRLDELPQLFNVLSGDMSLVGPRPERPVFVADLARQIPYYNQRHIVKPGLTGWAQINYPYGNTVQDALEKLQYDLFYIKNLSLLFDLSILFTTIKIVVLRKGT